MSINKQGNSVIEVMVVIVILTIGLTGAYNIINSGQKLSSTAENRIKAINIAREWLEAVENIRDTNWIKFSSDYQNCWKVKNYDITCIGNTGKEYASGSYILIQSWSSIKSLWYILPPLNYRTSWTSPSISVFPVYYDENGMTRQSWNPVMENTYINASIDLITHTKPLIWIPSWDYWSGGEAHYFLYWNHENRQWTPQRCSNSKNTNCVTIFTREIQISHPDNDHMKVNSIVTWVDNTRHTINLETILTNWKKQF